MKTLLLLSAFLASTSFAAPAKRQIPDLPPDASSAMYEHALGKRALTTGLDGLDNVVALGVRNLAWLQHINSLRPANDKLSLTSKETQHGIPIDHPSEYNPPLIQKKLSDLKPKIPQEMIGVLFGGHDFTDAPPVETKAYLDAARELDRVYQSALRWRMMAGYLDYLAERRHQDVRGYYFLSRLDGRAEKLRAFAQQSQELQAKLRGWLTGLCFNSDDNDAPDACASEVNGLIKGGRDLEAYYQQKMAAGKEIYEGYFAIPQGVGRAEFRFEDGAQPRLLAPFTDPAKDDVRHFLQDNIQDEWRFPGWHLELPFDTRSGLAHVEFQPGVTPHVNGIGGDTIVMNATQPLTEYDAQWTIRHEFGHVLGFVDCYVEFYERERDVIVNYQFDVDDLMCSRRGHIQQRHVDELKRTYAK